MIGVGRVGQGKAGQGGDGENMVLGLIAYRDDLI